MNEKITIWHNLRCSKSRAAFNLLKENNIEAEVFYYLKEAISEKELKNLLKMLDMKASDLVRKTEKIYKELKLKDATESQLIKAMLANPRLIERPIVIKNNKAVIGRPIENVIELLELG